MKGKTPTAQVRTQQGDLADTIQVLEGLECTNTYGWYKIIQIWKSSSKNPYLDDYYLRLIYFQILSCTWVSIACRPAHKQWMCRSYQLDTQSHITLCIWVGWECCMESCMLKHLYVKTNFKILVQSIPVELKEKQPGICFFAHAWRLWDILQMCSG